MVYASDFYTTRRPYTRSTPGYTSYSINNPRLTPAVGKAHTYHHSIPFIAHKRMSNVTTPVPHNQVRHSVIHNTLDRIQHRPRPHISYDPMEDFLNEHSVVSFDDVSRSIRANTAALLKKVHTPVPRAIRPLSISNQYNHIETPISERISSDEYVWHLLRPLPGKPSNGIDVGYYPESSVKVPVGKTHLACLSYAGSHPISKRRPLVAGAGDDYRNVRNDVELLSHYNKMRTAASQPHHNGDVHRTAGIRHEDNSEYKRSTVLPSSYVPETEKVVTNGATHDDEIDENKENISVGPRRKSLKKKPSRDLSTDEDRLARIDEERKAREAEDERRREQEERLRREEEEERVRQEQAAERARQKEEEERVRRKKEEEERVRQEEEEERLRQKKEEEERLRKEEEERLRQEEEERLRQEEEERTRREEEERLRKEEEQRLLEEKLVEEYHREQERLAAERRELQDRYDEEQQRTAQNKLFEEQQLLHDKLMEICKQQQRDQDRFEFDDENQEEEKSTTVRGEEENGENEVSYQVEEVDDDCAEDDGRLRQSVVVEAEGDNRAFTTTMKRDASYDDGSCRYEAHFERKTSYKFSTEHEEESNEEKSENTDANSEISDADVVPELNKDENQNEEEECVDEEDE